eukprot:1311105-Amphidinium_carterae.2
MNTLIVDRTEPTMKIRTTRGIEVERLSGTTQISEGFQCDPIVLRCSQRRLNAGTAYVAGSQRRLNAGTAYVAGLQRLWNVCIVVQRKRPILTNVKTSEFSQSYVSEQLKR